jgi:hypothetical protein
MNLNHYLAGRSDPQNYDHRMESQGRRAGVIDLASDIERVPTVLLLRTLERLNDLNLSTRADKLDTFIYED